MEKKLTLKPPKKEFHVYVSPNNVGAAALVEELKKGVPQMSSLTYTSDIRQMEKADRMLLLLNGRTWDSGDASNQLTLEMMQRLSKKRIQPYTLVHEAPALDPNDPDDAARFGVKFARFFDNTPSRLLPAGIYTPIALKLRGDIFREASLIQLCARLPYIPTRGSDT